MTPRPGRLPDRTLDLLREGYPWAARVRDGRSAVPIRFLGRRAVLVGGPEGVRRFYDPRLRRRGAVPLPVRGVLFGAGAVHGLDDDEHLRRKAVFLRLLDGPGVAELARHAEREWAAATATWPGRERVVLYDQAVQVLAAAALRWAGVPVPTGELPRRARQLAQVVDGFGTPGPAYARAARARWELDRWSRGLVEQVRAGRLEVPEDSPLRTVATARDATGALLPAKVAAVELLNLVRPTVAVAWFVAFAGLALHEQPGWRQRIVDGDAAALDAFVQEVRRRYPFVPVLAARARRRQDVLGVPVGRGRLVVLDVHGTDHDPGAWPDPERFDPGRFLSGPVDRDALVPQGGGDVDTGHRCPGESAVLTLLAVAVRALAPLATTLPPQELRHDPARMPTRPASGVLLSVAR